MCVLSLSFPMKKRHHPQAESRRLEWLCYYGHQWHTGSGILGAWSRFVSLPAVSGLVVWLKYR